MEGKVFHEFARGDAALIQQMAGGVKRSVVSAAQIEVRFCLTRTSKTCINYTKCPNNDSGKKDQ